MWITNWRVGDYLVEELFGGVVTIVVILGLFLDHG